MRTFRVPPPPCKIRESHVVTKVTTFALFVIMAVSNNSKESFITPKKKRKNAIVLCEHGNNMFVEQWIMPLVYNQLLEEIVNVIV